MGREAPRPIPAEFAEIAKPAVEYLIATTSEARKRAAELSSDAPLDWPAILGDDAARDYFVRRWLSDWISNPEHRLIDTRWAWYSRGEQSRWIPMADIMQRHEGNVSEIARREGLSRSAVVNLKAQVEASQRGEIHLGKKDPNSNRSFDTDRRFPSVMAFEQHAGLNTASGRRAAIQPLIEEARRAMLEQEPFAAPDFNADMEAASRASTDVLVDTDTGRATLRAEDALLVLFENQLSALRTNRDRVVHYSATVLSHWLAGYKRDLGTGKPTDAVCRRFDIRHPATGEIAKLTIHDLRHWLSTAYENGGLSPVQIATLFNRKSPAANSTYNQTRVSVRRDRLREAMKDGALIGHAAQAYDRIAAETPEEASIYLETSTKFYNPMPHGVCTLNWALEPCPHALSCFSCGEKLEGGQEPCEHLIVDPDDPAQVREIERINGNARAVRMSMRDIGAGRGPQYDQFGRAEASTETLLKRMGAKI
ncbi:hypothetical protein [Leisingera sp. ANG59]|uniref:hypothetical protein n=1 Tax=Leisingera sp. ANG59 TaxID=2675221 RepID=UPI00157202F8|nr:hypothetical protein [Leisingera sp. ANG59]NSY41624.1 hypothetical protein [Leisingera sp. ANG59]